MHLPPSLSNGIEYLDGQSLHHTLVAGRKEAPSDLASGPFAVYGLQEPIEQEHGVNRSWVLEICSERRCRQVLLQQFEDTKMHTKGNSTTSFPAIERRVRYPQKPPEFLLGKAHCFSDISNPIGSHLGGYVASHSLTSGASVRVICIKRL